MLVFSFRSVSKKYLKIIVSVFPGTGFGPFAGYGLDNGGMILNFEFKIIDTLFPKQEAVDNVLPFSGWQRPAWCLSPLAGLVPYMRPYQGLMPLASV